jgi:hypothetical protein
MQTTMQITSLNGIGTTLYAYDPQNQSLTKLNGGFVAYAYHYRPSAILYRWLTSLIKIISRAFIFSLTDRRNF